VAIDDMYFFIMYDLNPWYPKIPPKITPTIISIIIILLVILRLLFDEKINQYPRD